MRATVRKTIRRHADPHAKHELAPPLHNIRFRFRFHVHHILAKRQRRPARRALFDVDLRRVKIRGHPGRARSVNAANAASALNTCKHDVSVVNRTASSAPGNFAVAAFTPLSSRVLCR